MVKCEICGKEFDKSKRIFQSKYNICSNECRYIFLGNINRKHSMAHKTKLYGIWKSLRQRCENPNDKSYKNYGGRGICFCDEWKDFEKFYNWSINNGYKYEPLKSGRNGGYISLCLSKNRNATSADGVVYKIEIL